MESQGREVLYDITLSGGLTIRSIQSGGKRYRLGEQIRWGIEPRAILFFDENGNRI